MTYKIKKINYRTNRRDYSKFSSNLELPNLIELQLDNFKEFITNGIQTVFDEFFPIKSQDNSCYLSIDNWYFKDPRISIEKAKEESKIYDAPLYANVKLTLQKEEEIFKEDLEESEKKEIKIEELITSWLKEKAETTNVVLKKHVDSFYIYELQIKKVNKPDLVQIEYLGEDELSHKINVSVFKEDEVFFCDFPLMTDSGIFIINGSQKVIISQLVRSPGAYFNKEINYKTGETILHGNIIPNRGTWLEFETDSKKNSKTDENVDILNVKIDKSRKTSATSLLIGLGISQSEILNIFDNNELFVSLLEQDNLYNDEKMDWTQQIQEIYKKIRQGETATADGAYKFITSMLFDSKKYDLTKAGRFKLHQKLDIKNRILGKIIAENIVDNDNKVLIKKNTLVTKDNLEKISKILDGDVMLSKINTIFDNETPSYIQKVYIYEDNELKDKKELLIGIANNSNDLAINLADIIATISYVINLRKNIGSFDDIDNLGNRRVKTIGELLQNQFRIGLNRIEKNVKEKLSTINLYKTKTSAIINAKPLSSVIGEFFNLSQLSQFMDQINPLAELTNKRRITALGPGGLTRDRAALEVRDVHPSHYGRICPIETPEGPNIGLINNLTTYAKINEYGFITTPYRKVVNGKIQNDNVVYLTADEEKNFIIAQSNVNVDKNNKILDETVISRFNCDDYVALPNEIDYIDVSPKQIVSVATSGIPFLENDDANRALMGANMQRQAVPTIRPEAPYVATGIEFEAARDSGQAVVSQENGIVKYVDSKKIVIDSENGIKEYKLTEFERLNNGTSLTHNPIVKIGDKIHKGEIIADGPSMEKGELAVGQNVVVAFSTYNGYNFEDAIIMSERVIIDDKFTSLHIDEYTIEVRNTKQGAETITREIPHVSENAKRNIDEDGIVLIGTEVKVGDILVGKVTPKGQTQLSPEDKLLHAIFGEKTKNVKDNSLKVPIGGEGIVHSIKRFKAKTTANPNGIDLPADVLEIVKVFIIQKRKIQEGDKMSGRHGNKGIISKILPVEDMPHLEDGTPVDIVLNPQGIPSRMNIGQILELHLGMAAKKLNEKIITPVFEGLNEEELNDIMNEAGMVNYGKVKLIDGKTGESFDKPISVGVMYMLKLSHMVDDKLHARNIGSYSLITQQPLGGKAQNGGQRFGEMEVWALEAYGAAYTLREMLTIKSDDIKGRMKNYESIIRSKPAPQPGIPESFNVLSKEIMGLGFNIFIIDNEGTKIKFEQYNSADESISENEIFNEEISRDENHVNEQDIADFVEIDETEESYSEDNE